MHDIMEQYRKEILENNSNKVINLIGDTNSRFLRALDKRASDLGVVTVHNESMDRFRSVIDIETCGDDIDVNLDNDLDYVRAHGPSSVAEGVYMILRKKGIVEGKHVVIIGRGHSVKGLYRLLIDNDSTVTICHSKTQNLREICSVCDCIVTSTSSVVDNLKDLGKPIINIADGTPNGLSGLTTMILVHRAVMWDT